MRPRRETSMYYFSCSGGPGAVSIKKCAGTGYAKVVFLHSVRSVGHIVHSGASRAQNFDALFFMIGWTRCSIHK
jgi:hypothetical protein